MMADRARQPLQRRPRRPPHLPPVAVDVAIVIWLPSGWCCGTRKAIILLLGQEPALAATPSASCTATCGRCCRSCCSRRCAISLSALERPGWVLAISRHRDRPSTRLLGWALIFGHFGAARARAFRRRAGQLDRLTAAWRWRSALVSSPTAVPPLPSVRPLLAPRLAAPRRDRPHRPADRAGHGVRRRGVRRRRLSDGPDRLAERSPPTPSRCRSRRCRSWSRWGSARRRCASALPRARATAAGSPAPAGPRWVLGVGFMAAMALAHLALPARACHPVPRRRAATMRRVHRARRVASSPSPRSSRSSTARRWSARGMLRGLHDTRVPMIFTSFGYWVVGHRRRRLAGLPRRLGRGRASGPASPSASAIVAVLMLGRWIRRDRLGLRPRRPDNSSGRPR